MQKVRMRRMLSVLLVAIMIVALFPVDGIRGNISAAAAQLSITTQPKNTTVVVGDTAEFTVAATGTGTISYQWQSRKDAASAWSNSGQSGAKTKTLAVATTAGLNGWQFRCVVKDASGQKTTNAATLTVAPKITTQPVNAYAAPGGTAKFTIAATGAATLKYQWQSRKDASSAWSNSGQSGAKTRTLSVATSAGLNGWQFRCAVTDGNGNTTYSNVVEVLTKTGILTQPQDATVTAGSTAKFTVGTCGEGTFTYMWLSRKDSSSAWTVSSQSGAKSATLSVAATAGLNGWQFRCDVRDANGQKFYTKIVTLNVVPKITKQPAGQSVRTGATAKFTVAATGAGSLKYQWQSRKNSSMAWSNSGQSGAKTATLSVAASSGLNGWQFRCIVTDANGQKSISDAATLTVTASDDYVTYKMFGAKGDGKTNDYDAIVATHAYANANNKKVMADPGAVYYVDKMDPKNPKGAIIKTDTDWTGAEFIIDDSKMQIASYSYAPIKDDPYETKSVTYPADWDAQCYLFTVEPTIVYEKTWVNDGYWWRKQNGKWAYYKKDDRQDGDIKIYIGLDPDIASYNNTMYLRDPSSTFDMLNRSFTKDTEKLDGYFGEKALYALRTNTTVRWGRNGSEGASAGLRSQEEVVIVNADGTIDPMSRLQWDWKDIASVQKCYIDDTQLTVKGGKFTTIVNHIFDNAYIHRGINVTRSNVVLDGVEHYLTGEEAEYADHSFGFSSLYNREDAFARFGAPYQGFFRLDHCVNVTLRNCVFSNHHRVFGTYKPSTGKWSNDKSTAPYDFYAEYCVGIKLEGCTCAKSIIYNTEYTKGQLGLGAKVDPVYDKDGIMDDLRWGTSGTNYCKSIEVDGCSLNRIDAHMGTYDLTVKNSTMGWLGIMAVGFGKMTIENVTAYSDHFLTLRPDYGSAWYGDIEIKNCTWNLGTSYSPRLINARYDPQYQYGFDKINKGEKYPDGTPFVYYSQLPTNITIDGLTLDASDVTSAALFNGGLAIYTSLLPSVKETINDAYFMNRTSTAKWGYKYPLLPTEKVTLKNLTVIKNPVLRKTTFDNVFVAKVDTDYHGEYLFHDTIFDYDRSTTKVVTAGQ